MNPGGAGPVWVGTELPELLLERLGCAVEYPQSSLSSNMGDGTTADVRQPS